MSSRSVYAGVDLGGTSLLAVISDSRGKVLGSAKADTPAPQPDPAPVVAEIAKVVQKAARKADVKVNKLRAVGVGAPGSVDLATGTITKAANLHWEHVPLANLVENALDLPGFVTNDVQAAALGEHAHGAIQGARRAIAVWIGTGIGGGLILDGDLYRGAHGAAGEIGHMAVATDGPRCGCGQLGCVEALASRSAIARDIEAALVEPSVVGRIMREKKKSRITASVLKAALEAGDSVVHDVLAQAQVHLALLVSNLVNVLDPEVVVLGGGVVEKLGDTFVAPIREAALARCLPRPGQAIRIVPSALGDDAGSLGAAHWARRRLEGSAVASRSGGA